MQTKAEVVGGGVKFSSACLIGNLIDESKLRVLVVQRSFRRCVYLKIVIKPSSLFHSSLIIFTFNV
jgi:hypothetical protein